MNSRNILPGSDTIQFTRVSFRNFAEILSGTSTVLLRIVTQFTDNLVIAWEPYKDGECLHVEYASGGGMLLILHMKQMVRPEEDHGPLML